MFTHNNLKDRVAVITGGSGVLCSAMAKELAKQGVKVVLINRQKQKSQSVIEDIKSFGGEAICFEADVLNAYSLREAKKGIIKHFGKIDILINGAGGNHPGATTSEEYFNVDSHSSSFFDIEEDAFSNVFDLNFMGSFLPVKIFGDILLKSEHPVILNISSMSSYSPMTKVPGYSAAKAAINNFTMWLAVHFASAGLRVNAIAPGFFLTTQNERLLLNEDGTLTERSEKIISHTPMRRFGTPEDLIGTMLWLVDETYSGFVTGVTIPVDGGFMAYSGV